MASGFSPWLWNRLRKASQDDTDPKELEQINLKAEIVIFITAENWSRVESRHICFSWELSLGIMNSIWIFHLSCEMVDTFQGQINVHPVHKIGHWRYSKSQFGIGLLLSNSPIAEMRCTHRQLVWKRATLPTVTSLTSIVLIFSSVCYSPICFLLRSTPNLYLYQDDYYTTVTTDRNPFMAKNTLSNALPDSTWSVGACRAKQVTW